MKVFLRSKILKSKISQGRLFWLKSSIMVLFCAVFLWGGCAGKEILSEIPRLVSLANQERSEEAASDDVEAAGEGSGEQAQAAQGQGSWSFLGETPRYAYNHLNEREQLWYREIEQILGEMGENCQLSEACLASATDAEFEPLVEKIFQCVLDDHPELFYVDGYAYVKTVGADGQLKGVEFSGRYSLSPEEAQGRRQEIEDAVELLMNGISPEASDYEKVKYVYETIILETDYDLRAPDHQNIYSVFVNHVSVCQGYAKSVQYLLNRMGVECALVQGTVDSGEKHAWNLVKADGSYYYVDATWGDPTYQEADGGAEAGRFMPDISYDYLCITTAQLLRTHTLGNPVPLPECVDTRDNYYVREGALFNSYDREQMRALFDRRIAEGCGDVTIKCADLACYQEIYQALLTDKEIFDYMGNGTISYANNEKQLSMTFVVTNE